jgi:predicted molibdopterin-dependent oxidoreductase YjgC
VGAFVRDVAARADVFLPTSVWGEKTGTMSNLEGRVQRVAQLVTPEGTTMEDWRIAAEVASRFGVEFGFERVDDVQDELARIAPAFAGVDASLVRRARDGAVLPISEHADEIVLHSALGVSAGVSWEPIQPGVADDETHMSSMGTGAVEASGTGSLSTIKPGLTEADGGDAETVPELVEEATAVLEAAPALHVWSGTAPTRTVEPVDAYSLRLVVARTLYDDGSTAAAAPAFTGMAEPAALVVHPSDLARLGVDTEGAEVRVVSARTTVSLPVRTDAAIAPGTAFLPFVRPGSSAANELVDSSTPVTDVRVETTR